MASRPLRTNWVLMCIAVCTLGLGCNRSSNVAQSPPLRVFVTSAFDRADEQSKDCRGIVVWPASRKLGKYEIAHLADPLFDPKPTWGRYRGVEQAATGNRIVNALIVELYTKSGTSEFETFCRKQGYQRALVLVCLKDESTFEFENWVLDERIDEIESKYVERVNFGATDGLSTSAP